MFLNISGIPSLVLMLFDLTRLAFLSLCTLHQQKSEDKGESLVCYLFLLPPARLLRGVVFCLV